MVEHIEEISWYEEGDIVRIYDPEEIMAHGVGEWREVKLIGVFSPQLIRVACLQCNAHGNAHTFMVASSTIAITEREYEEIQLEKKFMTSW